MATEIFLGEPPANVKQWIIDHATPAPVTKQTKLTFIDGTYDEVPVEGELNETWFTQHNYYSGGTWLKKIISIELGENVTVVESALEGLDLAPVYSQTPIYSDHWTILRDSVDVTTQVSQPTYHALGSVWDVSESRISEDTAGQGEVTAPTDAVSLSWMAGNAMGEHTYTATRVRTDILGYMHQATLYKYANDTEWRTKNINGTIALMTLGDEGQEPTGQIDNPEEIVAIEIGTNVISIGNWAFYGLSELANLTIPSSVEEIGVEAFGGGCSIPSVIIPDSVTSIGGGAFSWSRLTSMTIPDSVTSIGENAFVDCSELTNVTIVATGKPGASAATIKDMLISAGVDPSITWNMPS